MTRGLVIRTQELGGKLVALGTDQARGITVQSPDFDADDWGPSAGSLILKRNPRVQWPDLRGGAPVKVTQGGVPIWLGRIKNTPMTDGGLARQISVALEGQQFRLDDDVYERRYVDANLANWKDWRSSLQCPLGHGAVSANGQVTTDGGAIVLGFGKGTVLTTNDTVAVLYDGGPAAALSRWTIWLQTSNNAAYFALYFSYMNNENGAGATVLQSQTLTAWGPGTGVTYTVPAGNRYLLAQMQYTDPGGTLSVDVWTRFMQMIEYSDAAYESSNASILKAHSVVGDALDRGTMGISSDRTLITPMSFSIPDFAMSKPSTPREAITGANAFHGAQARVRSDNRFEYRLRPSLATIEVGADSRFDEASAGDISQVYNGVIVTYTDAAGVEQRLVVSQPPGLETISALQLSNPSAAANTAGWGAIAGTLSRDTVVFDTTPASFKVTMISAGSFGWGVLSGGGAGWLAGSWVPGRSYVLAVPVRIDTPYNNPFVSTVDVYVSDGSTGAIVGRVQLPTIVANTWTLVRVPFTLQTAGQPNISVGLRGTGVGSIGWADSFTLTETAPTIVDRWGYKRTKVLDTGMSLTPAGAQQIADVFLAAHRSTPLKGKLVITGDGRARRSPSGQGMTCAELLNCTGDLVRMRHLTDPDTGKLGRLGRIVNVSYDAAANVASVDLDSSPTNFDALLARLAIVTGRVG